jgi:hypothetical protein
MYVRNYVCLFLLAVLPDGCCNVSSAVYEKPRFKAELGQSVNNLRSDMFGLSCDRSRLSSDMFELSCDRSRLNLDSVEVVSHVGR